MCEVGLGNRASREKATNLKADRNVKCTKKTSGKFDYNLENMQHS